MVTVTNVVTFVPHMTGASLSHSASTIVYDANCCMCPSVAVVIAYFTEHKVN